MYKEWSFGRIGGQRGLRKMKRSKKGISLAFVIIVVMALMILSAMLFSAASHSMDTTGESTDGRQTYLTAKSAIEYAKTVAFDKAKMGGLQPFSVGPNGGGYAETASAAAPDGTTIYAECTNPSGDGQKWKVLAKVKYKNSAQYRQLAYTFTLQYGSSLSAIDSFVAAGSLYGTNPVLNGNGEFSGSPSIPYPFISAKTIPITSQCAAAPEMYFLNPASSFAANGNDGTFGCTLDSNLIFFNGPIRGNSTDHLHNPQSLNLQNTKYNRLGSNTGIVWFHNTTIYNYNSSWKMKDGAYYFNGVVNLFDYSWLTSVNFPLTPVGDDFKNIPSLKAMNFPAKVSYYEANVGNAVSSESVGWTSDGHLNTNPVDQTQNDVFLYTRSDEYNGGNFRADLTQSQTYAARGIAMQYMGNMGTQNSPFVIPNTAITFQTGTFWLNAQSRDGYPWEDTNPDDVTTVQAANTKSEFILQSPDRSSPVALILPHGLKIVDAQNRTCSFPVDFTKGYMDVSNFTYSVESGTDLLELPSMTQSQRDSVVKKISGLGGGSGGGSGGFTITPGPYSGS